VELACPSCGGRVGGPYRRASRGLWRWRITVHHEGWCWSRSDPVFRGWVTRQLIGAAFADPGADGDEVEVAHRVAG